MRCRLLQIFLSGILLLGGCESMGPLGMGKPDASTEEKPLAKMPDTDIKSADDTDPNQPQRPGRMKNVVKIIRLQIDSVELPAGTAGKLEKLWTYLDEEPVSLHSTVLGMNGFRVGVGKKCDWAEVESLLSKQGGLSFQKKIIETRLGSPVHLEMLTDLPVQNIFVFSDAQTLRGQHFPPGDNLLTMSTFIDEETVNDVIVAAVPQIRSSTRHFDIETDNNDPRIVYKNIFYPLEEMAFRVKMPLDDFLVIGPGSQAGRPNSVARHFLTRTRQGMNYDRIFIIRPQIVRVPIEAPAERSGQ